MTIFGNLFWEKIKNLFYKENLCGFLLTKGTKIMKMKKLFGILSVVMLLFAVISFAGGYESSGGTYICLFVLIGLLYLFVSDKAQW